MKIDEATLDTEVTGVERVPASDAGVAKAITTASIGDYVLGRIEAQKETTAISLVQDGVYLLRSGEIRPINAETLAAKILEYGFGLDKVAEANGNETFAVSDNGTSKSITIEVLKTWLEKNMTIAADLDISSFGVATKPYDGGSYLVMGVGDATKRVTIANMSAWILERFSAFVTDLTKAQSLATDDVLYVVQGGTAKKCTVGQIQSLVASGNVNGPTSTTEGNVPRWDATTRTLTDGVEIVNSIADTPSGTKLATEGAVRVAIKESEETTDSSLTALETSLEAVKTDLTAAKKTETDDIAAVREEIAAIDGVKTEGTTQANYIPRWGSEQKTLTAGIPLVTSVRNAANASNTAIPTEKAVRDVADGFIAASDHNENAIPLWGAANELKAGVSLTTVLASSGSDEKVPTEKAVRDALPVAATQAAQGLMSAADKKKLDNLTDTSGAEEIGGDLGDTDTVIVTRTSVGNRKSLLSRVWTYIQSKLPTVTLDSFAAALDNTNLNASITAHGLCPKLDGNDSTFLRGDGTFAKPKGSDAFVGTDGTTAGDIGLVPAPAAGDTEKFLSATGSWVVPPSAAGVDIYGATAMETIEDDDLAYFYSTANGDYRKVTAAQIRDLALVAKRYDTLFVGACAMTPSDSNGAEASSILFTNTTHDTLKFVSTADTKAEFSVVFPDDWDKGAVKAKVLWTYNDSTTGEAGQAVGFAIGAVSYADGGNISTAPSSLVLVGDIADSANELHRTDASAEITIGGTAGDGNLVHFMLKRNTAYAPEGTTAMPTDALVLGVVIQFGRTTTTAQW